MTHSDDFSDAFHDLLDDAPHEMPDIAPLDAGIQTAAHAYHAPPPVPTEAMWAAIQARRAAHASSARTPGTRTWSPVVQRSDSTAGQQLRRPLMRQWTPLAAAAVVLLSVGIGVGRRTVVPTAPTTDGIARVDTARAPQLAVHNGDPERDVEHAPDASANAQPTRSTRATHSGRAPQVVTAEAASPRTPSNAPPAHVVATPLRTVTEQHLAQAEVMLSAFVADERRDGRASTAPDSAWARDLLTTTRLLLDSPAASDPARHRLLEDLELVLVQIARLPRADTPAERALIDRAIRRGDLMAKLRAGTPTGPSAGATTPLTARGS